MILYEIKIAYERQTGEDNPGNVKETYLVEGLTCSDVEQRLLDDIKPFISGDWEVSSCKKVQYMDLIEQAQGEYFYKGRVELITVEDDGKETRKRVSVLVQASTMTQALKRLEEHLSGMDHELVSLTKTAIIDLLHAVN